MQAIVQSGYGTSEVLSLREVERPVPRAACRSRSPEPT